MKFRIKFAQQVVGAFILLALILLGVTLILMGVNQRWFAKNYHFTSWFQTAEGLSSGMSIKLRGFEIGKLSKIELTPENRVSVELEIYDTYYPKIKPNSVLELVSSPIGIGGGLVFLPGKNDSPPLQEGSFIPSGDTELGKKLIADQKVDRLGGNEAIAGIINQVEPLLIEVRSTVTGVNELLGQVNDALDGTTGTPAPGMVGQLQTLLAGINSTVGNVNQTIVMASGHTDRILGSAADISGDIARITKELEDIRGLVPKLLDPKGSLARILDDDDALYLQIETLMKQLNETLREVNTFSRYINRQSPQITGILEESKQAIKQGQDVLEGVSNNPLLKGGITERKAQGDTFRAFREEDF